MQHTFSFHAVTKSSKTYSRPRKEIQSSVASFSSSAMYSSNSAHEATYDSMSALTSSSPANTGGAMSKCAQSRMSLSPEATTFKERGKCKR